MAPALLCDATPDWSQHIVSKRQITNHPSSPKIAALDCSIYESQDDLITDIIQSLKLSGGCLVRGMYSQQTLDDMEKKIRPHIEATQKADAKRENFVPSTTKMVTGLLSKSRTYALSVAGNKTWHRVCDHFLSSRLTNSWVGQLYDERRLTLTEYQAWKRSENQRECTAIKHNSYVLCWSRNEGSRPPPRRRHLPHSAPPSIDSPSRSRHDALLVRCRQALHQTKWSDSSRPRQSSVGLPGTATFLRRLPRAI